MSLFKIFRGQKDDLKQVALHDGYSYVAVTDDNAKAATFYTDAPDSNGTVKRYEIGVTEAERAAWNAKQDAITIDETPTKGSTNPVTSDGVKSYVDGSASAKPYQTRISFSTSWQGSDPYTQEVTVEDATENSRVDLHPMATTLVQLAEDGVSALYVENTNGTFTANAIGGPPSTSMLMLATVTEVTPAAQIPNTMTLSKSSISLDLTKTSDTFYH